MKDRSERDVALLVCSRILRVAARIGPREWRRDGIREWEGELWALRRRGGGAGALLRFAMHGVLHAFWRRREEWLGMSGWAQDLRMAIRRLTRTPEFTTITVLILGLGIGANTALFSALRAALAGSGRYTDADRLVLVDVIQENKPGVPFDTLPWSYPKFSFLRERSRSLESLAAFHARDLTLKRPGDATRVGVEVVSPAYFQLLGARPVIGRTFLASEDPPDPGAVAILGHALWMTRFGGDPSVIGGTVTVEDVSFEVVGVMPAGFRGLTGRADLWVPVASAPALLNPRLLEGPWLHWFRAVGRLAPGTTLEQARAELATLGAVMTETYPYGGGAYGVAAVPFLSARVNPVTRLALSAVFAGGLLLLAITCANVASLLLARASARRTDVAVRAALGAGRGRLVREHLLESLVLATAGGVLGVVLARVSEGVIARAARYTLETSGTRSLEYLDPTALRVDGSTLALAVLLALATGLVSGLLPLRTAVRPDLARDLRAGSARVLSRLVSRGEGGRGILVATQLALTLVLLAGAGLMAASLARLAAVDVGFAYSAVLTLRFERRALGSDAEALAFEEELLSRLGALPGVVSVATAPCPPLTGACSVTGIRQVDDRRAADPAHMERIVTYAVSDDYFATLGVPILQGGGFEAGVRAGEPPVAVLSETAARRLFGGSAVGHRIGVTVALTSEQPAEVVGVVADVRYDGLEVEPMPAIYFSRRQMTPWYGTVFLRMQGDPYGVLEAVREEARSLDPAMPLFEVSTLGELRGAATARTRVILGLLLSFALLGLLLSAAGIYGVVSYAVVRRTREMGLRLALGATAHAVVQMIVRRPVWLALAGSAAGLAGALALTRYLQELLFAIKPWDPRIMAAAMGILVSVALAAAWIPARRATRLDPAQTLRAE